MWPIHSCCKQKPTTSTATAVLIMKSISNMAMCEIGALAGANRSTSSISIASMAMQFLRIGVFMPPSTSSASSILAAPTILKQRRARIVPPILSPQGFLRQVSSQSLSVSNTNPSIISSSDSAPARCAKPSSGQMFLKSSQQPRLVKPPAFMG